MSADRRAGLVAWLSSEKEREIRREQAATDAEDKAFHQGMHDAYELTIREVQRRGIE